MTRKVKYGIFSFLFLFLTAAAAISWLLATPEGARWIFGLLSRRATVRMEIGKIEGSFIGGLNLEDLRIQWPQIKAEIEGVHFRLSPLSVLSGSVIIKELVFNGVSIQDNRKEKKIPPDLSWPVAPIVMRPLSASIETFEINGFAYKKASNPAVQLSMISGRFVWDHGIFGISNLLMSSASATVRGKLFAGFIQPLLITDLIADLPAQETAGIKKLNIKARLVHSSGPEQVAGNITLASVSSSERHTELTGEIGLTRSSINLRNLHLKQQSLKGDIGGEGVIIFPEGSPFFKLRTTVASLDLAQEIKSKTNISGAITFNGTVQKYDGIFSFSNAGKVTQSVSLSGSFEGDSNHAKLGSFDGAWLNGKITGAIEIGWKEKVSAKGEIKGTGLNPALISPEWSGVVNLALNWELYRSGKAPLEGYVNGHLLESRLRGRALTGEIRTRLSKGNVIIDPLDLHGRGFDIHAAGELDKQIAFTADIRDLAGLVPDTQGRLRSQGWLTYSDGIITFAAGGNGRAISAAGTTIDALTFNVFLGSGKDRPIGLVLDLKGLVYKGLRTSYAHVETKGTVADHVVVAALRSSGSELRVLLSGSYKADQWQGKITRLSGKDNTGSWSLRSPADLRISKRGFFLSPVILLGVNTEHLAVAADLTWPMLTGYVRSDWNSVKLEHADNWLTDMAISGESSGRLSVQWMAGKIKLLEGSMDGFGTLRVRENSLTVKKASSKIDWSERRLFASFQLALAEKGDLSGSISSSAPVSAALPEKGEIHAELHGLDPAIFQPWFPRGLSIKGPISGSLKGNLLPGHRLDTAISASVSEGTIQWQHGKSQVTAKLRNTALSAVWRDESMAGSIDLTLANYGQLRTVFRFPLPARIPVHFDPKGVVDASVQGNVQENGLLSSVFPGLIEDSRGSVNIDLRVGGQWENPVTAGIVRLSKAGAYFPTAGIHLKEVGLLARLERKQIIIENFKAGSGQGSIEGSAAIRLQNMVPAEYHGSIKGKLFQVIYLPELQVLANPDINFEGTAKKMSVRGEVIVPELTALSGREPSPVVPSKDVIVVDVHKPEKQKPPFALDLRVRVTLGEKVVVKAQGADIQLSGSVDLAAEDLEDIRGSGVINIVKGKYAAYGMNLDITRGRLKFDGPVDRPILNIQAERIAGEVRAGVLVTGTLQKPTVKLYSKPPLSDPDIMAYLALGHRLESNEDFSLVAQAAGALLPRSESTSIQDQLRRRLHLDTLDIQSVKEGTFTEKKIFRPEAGRTGVFEEEGATPGGVTRSMVTVGKYLTPKLYLSIGRSLFTDANLLRLRYEFSKHWELQTESGEASGGDIFYKIEFR